VPCYVHDDMYHVLCWCVSRCIVLDVTDDRYTQVHGQIRENIQQADSTADLKWWSVNRGPEMIMSWPTYEVRDVTAWFQQLISIYVE